MINFYEPSLKTADHGQCRAVTRRESSACAHYVASAGGWCAWTRQDYRYEVPDGKDAWGHAKTKERVVKGMVSGVCMSEAAARAAGEAGK